MVTSNPQTTELSVYERISDPVAAMITMGAAIAKSGMFGCGSLEAGQVFAMECLARRMPPLMLAERYHVIFGKLSMKAEAMLAGFEEAGGKYKVIERGPDRVAVEMTIGGQSQTLSLTWEDAQKEPFVYEGKEGEIVDLLTSGDPKKLAKLKLKSKYATPRSRTQMLWARLVSDGVRFLCPSVVSGTYTPEEIDDVQEADASANGNGAAGRPRKAAAVIDSTVVESPAVAAVATPAASPPAAAPAEPPADAALATRAQIERLTTLYTDLGVSGDTQQQILATFKVGSFRSLTSAQIAKLIAKAEEKWAVREQEAKAAAQSIVPPSPSTNEQQAEIQELFKQYMQVDPTAAMAFKDKLQAARGPKGALKTLSHTDAERLKAALQNKQLANFFNVSLQAWQPATANQPAGEAASG